MEPLKAEFEIVTPVIMGGGKSDQKVSRLRPPSIKGALRFWWRARHWGKHFHENNGDAAAALRALHAEEADLFGVAAGHDQDRQSRVLLRIDDRTRVEHLKGSKGLGTRYLLGQGLQNRTTGLMGEFDLHFRFHPSVTDDQIKGLRQALWLFGLLGGLGARSRRGIGSVAIRKLNGSTGPLTELAYRNYVKEHRKDLAESQPPFSALSTDTRIEISLRHSSYTQILSSVGQEFQSYRKDHFKGDAGIARRISQREPQDRPPQRLAFGLPHNYYFKDSRQSVEIQPDTEGRERRASPLFLHIHKLPAEPKDPYAAVHCHLPGTFLPEGDTVEMRGGTNFSVSVNPHHDADVVPAYLNHFSDVKRIL